MSSLVDYMSPGDLRKITAPNGYRYPTYHTVMLEKTGKCRPGKTARDRARGVIR